LARPLAHGIYVRTAMIDIIDIRIFYYYSSGLNYYILQLQVIWLYIYFQPRDILVERQEIE
jgi:hypothetical protein